MTQTPIDIPPGLKSDDTNYSSTPAWVDGSNMRFRLGRGETIGGWESLTLSTLTGVCRAVLAWTENSGTLDVAFGTHSNLQLWQGGGLYDITPSGLAAGQIDATGSSGYGSGSWNVGAWGQPSAADFYPRTWSLAAWGQKLLASPRGGTIYEWSNNTASLAVAVSNAPANVTQMLVSPQRSVFALGCTQASGTWNPLCIRHSGEADETAWAIVSNTDATTAREYILPGGGRIVGGRFVGKSLLIWTTQNLFLGTYVGQLSQVWKFDKVGDKCGLIGPNAVAVLDTTAYWVSPDKQFHSYTPGNVVQPIACPIRKDFADNVALSQADKITASTVAAYGEVWWDYPDGRDGTEVSRYLAVCVAGTDAGSWFRGKAQNGVSAARTARVDAGPAQAPIGVTADGHVYWHETGHSADGQAMPWFLTSSDVYLNEDTAVLVRRAWPDIAEQVGAVSLTLSSSLYPQGTLTTYGPFTVGVGQDQVDFKASGRLFQMTWSAASLPSFARIGRTVFDIKPRGRKG